MVQTAVEPFSPASVAHAADLILAGQPVAVPTETVYGLATDATNGEAVARIYAAKGRPSFNPLIVHVSDLAQAERFGVFSERARQLAHEHWPGPLTLVVPARPDNGIADLVTAGLTTIALRVPAHRAMRALLEAARCPLAAPSANASGRISPTRAEHVLATLDNKLALVVDDGPTYVGVESTIVLIEDDKATLLRPGPILLPEAAADSSGAIRAPGQLSSHYAPRKPLRLNAEHPEADEFFIGFKGSGAHFELGPPGDLVAIAANLFAALHCADRVDKPRIAVAPVAPEGLGLAINDRLARAASDARTP